MADGFDTLGYARPLEDAGILRQHAEAHATAARTFIMADLATKADLQPVKAELQVAIKMQALRRTVRLGAMMGVMIGEAVAVIGAFVSVLGL